MSICRSSAQRQQRPGHRESIDTLAREVEKRTGGRHKVQTVTGLEDMSTFWAHLALPVGGILAAITIRNRGEAALPRHQGSRWRCAGQCLSCHARATPAGTQRDPSPPSGALPKGDLMNKSAQMAMAIALAVGSTLTIGTLGIAHATDSEAAKTRADVLAELIAARASGELAALAGEDSGSSFLSSRHGRSTRTRAQLIGELLVAQATGELGALVGEDSGSEFLRRLMPEHWTRYAGPDIGGDASEVPQQEQRVG